MRPLNPLIIPQKQAKIHLFACFWRIADATPLGKKRQVRRCKRDKQAIKPRRSRKVWKIQTNLSRHIIRVSR
jgi:hypothetical protein